MYEESDSSPLSRTVQPSPRKNGQVCDRCRAKKIKCDGDLPSCSNCVAAQKPCAASTILRRKTKIRGFTSNEDNLLQSLRDENAELREKLQAEKAAVQSLRQELESERQLQQVPARPRKLTRIAHQPPNVFATSPLHDPSSDAGASLPDRSMYMIKHMGRLVHDQSGVGRFAGSTTGVHFVMRVEEAAIQSSLNYNQRFGEASFSLYLSQPTTIGSIELSEICQMATGAAVEAAPSLLEETRKAFPLPQFYYVRQVDEFLETWQSFCPVLVRKEFVLDIERLFSQLRDLNSVKTDFVTAQKLAMVLAINQIGSREGGEETYSAEEATKNHVKLAYRLLTPVASHADLPALQSLILFAFYVQLSGQSLWLVQLNGLLVRIAHSLGLHRHDRRFKYCAGKVELRRRMWWWVYNFDKITSVVHGLPRLISDTDVDNDMPTDCELVDTNDINLSHPLPGEITPIFFFNQSILLGKKISTILEQLYTTTARRGGAEKITRLDRDLRVWNHAFNSYPHVNAFEIGFFTRQSFDDGNREGHVFINCWLQLLANIAMMLIHRPGLTFDTSTPEFCTSLKNCVTSCTSIIEQLSDDILGSWLQNKCPSGPALVFQCALMHIYLHCTPVIPPIDGLSNSANSRRVVAKARSILEAYPSDDRYSEKFSYNGTYMLPVKEAVRTLEALELALPRESDQGESARVNLEFLGDEQILVDSQPGVRVPDVEMWNNNVLESLNNLGDFDWIFDETGDFTSFQ